MVGDDEEVALEINPDRRKGDALEPICVGSFQARTGAKLSGEAHKVSRFRVEPSAEGMCELIRICGDLMVAEQQDKGGKTAIPSACTRIPRHRHAKPRKFYICGESRRRSPA